MKQVRIQMGVYMYICTLHIPLPLLQWVGEPLTTYKYTPSLFSRYVQVHCGGTYKYNTQNNLDLMLRSESR